MSKAISTLGFLCLFALAQAGGPAAADARTLSKNTQAPAQETAELGRLRELAQQSNDDPEPWREYGEALARSGDRQGAVKALAEALKRYVKVSIGAAPKGPGPAKERAARNRAWWAAQLRRAPETVERYIQLGGAQPGFEREQLEAFAAQARLLNETDAERGVFVYAELDHTARIRSKPEPGFTARAKQNIVTGVVRLRAVLANDGKVRHVFLIKGLPDGLNDLCVAAAHRIRFEPALKDGKPVSQFVILEYYFSAY